MSQHCCELHGIVNKMNRHHFPFEDNLIPRNGVFLLFETGNMGMTQIGLFELVPTQALINLGRA